MTGNTSAEVVDFPDTPWDEAEHGTVAVPRAELAEVVDGVIVDDEAAVSRPPSVVQVVIVRPVQVIKVVVKHDHTKTAGRHLMYIPLGALVAAKRLWDSRSSARYDRMLRMAEATGNLEAAGEWEDRKAKFLAARHQRRVDTIELPLKVILALPKIALGLFAVLATMGVFLATGEKNVRGLAEPFLFVGDVVKWATIAFSIAWGPILLVLPWIAVGALWWLGKTAGVGPAWVRTAGDADMDVAIDETTIAKALEALRIPQITAYIKQGMPMQYITPCRRDGRGTHAVIRLPAGVTAERIARRRADFATGLYRMSKEVWPKTGDEAGVLDLWVADKGALAEGAGPYPLLSEGVTDVFRGVPFGRTLRGDPVIAPLMERNTLTGGMPGQGKSGSARVIMCGAALDPTAELWVLIPDANYDFEVMKRRCSRYVMGAEDDRIREIRDYLSDLRDEVQRRGELLIRHEEPSVTRKMASAGVGLHPLFVLLEEAHVAITHHTYGKDIAGLLVDIVKLGRKRGIHMIVSTQAPTKDSMPRDVTRNCSNGIAFAVGDHVANDALLGQGAYSAGHRATELIPGTDRGTAVVKGFSGERSEIVQVYFLDVAKGNDQVTPIIDRAMAMIAELGHSLPGKDRPLAIESRDLLGDLDQVLGDDRVKLADLPARLRKLTPGWGPYRTLTGVQLRDLLDAEGVRTTNAGNVARVDPADVRRVLAERRAGDGEVR